VEQNTSLRENIFVFNTCLKQNFLGTAQFTIWEAQKYLGHCFWMSPCGYGPEINVHFCNFRSLVRCPMSTRAACFYRLFWYSYKPFFSINFNKKVVARLTAHDDIITPLNRGTLRLGLALDPAPARAGPVSVIFLFVHLSRLNLFRCRPR